MIAHNFAQIVDVCDRVIALQHGAITYAALSAMSRSAS